MSQMMSELLPVLVSQLERAYECNSELPLLMLQSALVEKIPHGSFEDWVKQIEALDLWIDKTEVSDIPRAVGQGEPSALLSLLHELKPWRKGHFDLLGIDLDGEWRSELKYQRLLDLGMDFTGKTILDVGCGNGYYMLRLLGNGARAVLGIDPSFHYLAQYLLLARCFPILQQQSAFLPLTLDDGNFSGFDLTLSMGVLYHRKDPVAHLKQLAQTLQPNGRLLLETLVLTDADDTVLIPPERYAGMRNVYHIPSTQRLIAWLAEAGLAVEKVSDYYPTTTAEQRKTEWLDSYSLAHFLNADQTQTIENLPPPTRQIIVAYPAL